MSMNFFINQDVLPYESSSTFVTYRQPNFEKVTTEIYSERQNHPTFCGR
jgi:hypothetical protein